MADIHHYIPRFFVVYFVIATSLSLHVHTVNRVYRAAGRVIANPPAGKYDLEQEKYALF
ncbi:hypothetical protein NT01EI_1746 [Edwardsiella ictaluri 93-146]|uniref:Uncharacterized protein n=1 Tax=Edwardsiella ictaluri (strain 93-146) TaxID=634503 RepID=C5BE05_EDWI9|nr:hypothetical protein NT01EI_1746 [Edwardsiella ictaluri 93-146]